jgi:squalene/oxidosqualene cyclase-like protein
VDAIARGLEHLARSQTPEGSLRREYDGPLFLLPGYVFACYAAGEEHPEERRAKLLDFLAGAQNEDGGYGLHVEGRSSLFSTVLNYVALRLLGARAEDPVARAARAWIERHGGAVSIPSWGKCWLATLGLYEWEGVNPLPPELWLLPRWFPVHPRRFWCHARVIYLALSYLYGRRWRVAEEPLLGQIRSEIFAPARYEDVDWRAARNDVFAGDVYTAHSRLLHVLNVLLGGVERAIPRRLRKRALAHVLDHVKYEDESTGFICLGPVNKALNVVVVHAAEGRSDHAQRALDQLTDAYLYEGEAGLTMQAYNSSENWDTAFAAQALATAQRVGEFRVLALGLLSFVARTQVDADPPRRERYHRGPARGGWPFSNRSHGWPIADCTAEGMKAVLALEPELEPMVARARLVDAVDLLLALQNADGGWPTYERIRGGRWLELLNASELFADIMVDYSYVELTSSAMQGLVAARGALSAELGQSRLEAIEGALGRGERYLREAQRADGSWEGLWGICFTYGAWFGVWGLRARGAARDDPAVRAAAEFLLAKQLGDGGWGESYESCVRRAYVPHPAGGQPVMTAWALLALLEAEVPGVQEAVERGLRFLVERQLPDGDWPQRSVTGVFNKTCMLNYACYRGIFPVWALALAERHGHRP